jgi:hypothetical protein
VLKVSVIRHTWCYEGDARLSICKLQCISPEPLDTHDWRNLSNCDCGWESDYEDADQDPHYSPGAVVQGPYSQHQQDIDNGNADLIKSFLEGSVNDDSSTYETAPGCELDSDTTTETGLRAEEHFEQDQTYA